MNEIVNSLKQIFLWRLWSHEQMATALRLCYVRCPYECPLPTVCVSISAIWDTEFTRSWQTFDRPLLDLRGNRSDLLGSSCLLNEDVSLDTDVDCPQCRSLSCLLCVLLSAFYNWWQLTCRQFYNRCSSRCTVRKTEFENYYM